MTSFLFSSSSVYDLHVIIYLFVFLFYSSTFTTWRCNADDVLTFDDGDVHFVDYPINVFVEIGQSTEVRLLAGAAIAPFDDGLQTPAANVGQVSTSAATEEGGKEEEEETVRGITTSIATTDAKLVLSDGVLIWGASGDYGANAVNVNPDCEFVMDGGTVQGGLSTAQAGFDGGHGIELLGLNSIATINDGRVTPGNWGSAIFLKIGSILTITGGVINGDIKAVGFGTLPTLISISGGQFARNSVWELSGEGITVNVWGCITEYDVHCLADSLCPLNGILSDGSLIQVYVLRGTTTSGTSSNTVQIISTCQPTDISSHSPTATPTISPTNHPSSSPSTVPTNTPTLTSQPTSRPSTVPTDTPTIVQSSIPTSIPTTFPSTLPTPAPQTQEPSLGFVLLTSSPTNVPTSSPTATVSSNKETRMPSMLVLPTSETPTESPINDTVSPLSNHPSMTPSAAPSQKQQQQQNNNNMIPISNPNLQTRTPSSSTPSDIDTAPTGDRTSAGIQQDVTSGGGNGSRNIYGRCRTIWLSMIFVFVFF